MARRTSEDRTDVELESMLRAAIDDEREGRIVHCTDEDELRTFLQTYRSDPA